MAVKAKQQQQDWRYLFDIIENIANSSPEYDVTDNEHYASLSKFWQKRLLEISAMKPAHDRQNKTLELEIFAGVDSPKEFTQDRMKMQIELLQHQMLSGEKIDLANCFLSWLQLGSFSENDLPLISRVKSIYC